MVSGRGDLHLGLIFENMRREGYEMLISPPTILTKKSKSGKEMEPIELVSIEVEPIYTSSIIEKMTVRSGIYLDSEELSVDLHRLKFEVPTRGLIGFRSELLHETKGSAVIITQFKEY